MGADREMTIDGPKTLPTDTYTKEGYKIIGWTRKMGMRNVYPDFAEGNFIYEGAEIDDESGGSVVIDYGVRDYFSYKTASSPLVYESIYWACIYQACSTVDQNLFLYPNEEITLYPIWQEEEFTVNVKNTDDSVINTFDVKCSEGFAILIF